MNKSAEDLGEAFSRLDQRLIHIEKNLDNKIELAADHAALERIHELSTNIQDRIEKQIRAAFILVGGFIAVLGAMGYLGIQTLVSSAVKDRFDSSVLAEINQKKLEVDNALKEIQTARLAIRTNPLIVLQTDFGPASPYMGTLKGVIYRTNPYARIDVITSDIKDYDLLQASWVLVRASRYYPKGTIFICITNPGGITTQPIVVITNNGHIYIGHDNGVFDLVVQAYGHQATYTIASPEVSPTEYRELFGGVDIFGPAAGLVSLGYNLEKIGPKRDVYEQKLPNITHRIAEGNAQGTIMDVDKFGNATLNITKADLEKFGLNYGEHLTVILKEQRLNLILKHTYSDASRGEMVAVLYDNYLQLAVNMGSFGDTYRVSRGNKVTLTK